MAFIMTDTTMIDRLKQFVESEMRSCSMDIGALHHYTFTGCGEEQWLSKRYRQDSKNYGIKVL